MLEAISLFFGAFLDATIGPNLFVPASRFCSLRAINYTKASFGA